LQVAEKRSKVGGKKQGSGSKGNKKGESNTTGNASAAIIASSDNSSGIKREEDVEERKLEELPPACIKIKAIM
jgi:hypothetical protein